MENRILLTGKPGSGKSRELVSLLPQAGSWLLTSFTKKSVEDLRKRVKERFPTMKDTEINNRVRTLHSFLFREFNIDREKSFPLHLARHGRAMGFSFGKKLQHFFVASGRTGSFLSFGSEETEDDMVYTEGLRLRALGLGAECSTFQGRSRKILFLLFKIWNDAWSRGYWDYTWLLEEAVRRKAGLKADFVGYDECNDFSKLMFNVTSCTEADRTVIACDPDQSLYTFMGASPKHVFELDFSEQISLPVSHRVPAVLGLYADKALDGASDRSIIRMESSRAGGIISAEKSLRCVLDQVKGNETLVLTRTNYMADQLEHEGIRDFGLNVRKNIDLRGALSVIRKRDRDFSVQARMDLSSLPQKYFQPGGQNILQRWRGQVTLTEVIEHVAGVELSEALQVGDSSFLDKDIHFHQFDSTKPEVRFMTMHASKGLGADDVVIVRDSTKKIEEESRRDDEIRLYYVALTRAKKRIFEPDYCGLL